MLVSEVMTSPVLVIQPKASIAEAARIMLGARISGLPVVEDGRLVGILTEGDFLHRGELGSTRKRARWLELFTSSGKRAEEYVQSHGRRVEDLMTPRPVTIGPDATLERMIDLMTARKVKRVPVVDAAGKLVGIVARSDVMRAVLRALPASAPAATDDERIRAAIADELGKHSWSAAVRVKVSHGAAELTGAIFDERAREAARVAAENVPGVTQVVDRLCWIEPMSGMYLMPPGAMYP